MRIVEYILCSIGHTHGSFTDFREAKLEQIRLFLEEDVEAWIEQVKETVA